MFCCRFFGRKYSTTLLLLFSLSVGQKKKHRVIIDIKMKFFLHEILCTMLSRISECLTFLGCAFRIWTKWQMLERVGFTRLFIYFAIFSFDRLVGQEECSHCCHEQNVLRKMLKSRAESNFDFQMRKKKTRINM